MTKEEKILGILRAPGYVPMRAEALAAAMEVPEAEKALFYDCIEALLAQNLIIENKKGRLKARNTESITGKFKALRSGGFVDALDNSVSVFVPLAYTKNAIDGDMVVCSVRTKKKPKPGEKPEGEVTEILRHTLTQVVGTLALYGGALYLEPDDAALTFGIRIRNAAGAKAGDKAIVKIEKYPTTATFAEGSIVKILGTDGSPEAELAAISHKAGLRTVFEKDVLLQAEAAEAEPIVPDGRTDFRAQSVITIDGDDSKDFDDAVCVEKTQNGYTLYVHIADVTHYVTAGSPLDKEAYRRGTSVYYPGSVLPMLPEALSNGICSLNPNVDRYTLSVTMQVDKSGAVTAYKIENGIICSKARMTYKRVTEILENQSSPLRAEYAALVPMLEDMHDLADLLTSKRTARGSVDFNIPEPHIVLDETGFPAFVAASEVGISNKIIEEFMLLANETVARHAATRQLPFVYRVHEAPNEDKIESLNAFLGYMGLPALQKGTIKPQAFATLMQNAQETDNPALVSMSALRAMMKARYDAENLGHFGLALTDYCHFTSPIRRYPDLFIHRVLKAEISGTLDKEALLPLAVSAAENSTETELAAVDAEREADKFFTCLYMQQYVGCEFEAVISSVTDFGIFVTVGGAIDGMIPFSALDDDYYIYEAERYCLRGERTRKIYALGDTLQVKLVSAQPKKRKLDFAPLGVVKREKKPYARLLNTKKKKDKRQKKQKGKTQKFIRKKR